MDQNDLDAKFQAHLAEFKRQATPRGITKMVAGLVVGHCASSVVKRALRNNVATEGKTQKVKLEVGAYAVGATVAMRTKRVIDNDIDDLFDFFTKLRTKPASKTEPELGLHLETDPVNPTE